MGRRRICRCTGTASGTLRTVGKRFAKNRCVPPPRLARALRHIQPYVGLTQQRGVMDKRLLLTLALLATACRDAVSPRPQGRGAPAFAVTAGSGITLDQQDGTFNDVMPWSNGGSHVGMGFTPRNPHVGDAIVATFFWVGSTNTITTVTDHLSDAAQTPVGNTYTLIDYVTFGGISMATYVATNVRGFPDASTATDSILAVHAIFSAPIPDGGVLLSAWSGVSSVSV